ncbi:MAG: PqqD family protein [Deltaproteobacteria bacterium]
MKESIVFLKNKDFVARKIAGETVLMPLFRSSDKINCLYSLADNAGRVWELIDGKSSIGQIKRRLLEEYAVSEERLDKELDEFFSDLKSIKAVRERK